CAGLGYDNNLYIIDVKRGKWEAPELLKEAKAFINKHKDSNTKLVEPVNYFV
ncbi:helicase, partial [Acinetobacter baumannii]